jgi:SAM-dependent methyltransferase
LKEGETVLDLGSGAGFDCFLAANQVGKSGRVIGIDMTPEMVEKARENAEKGNYKNVEFRLGELENLPAADNSVDVIISNCVINLVPNKSKTFLEAFRVIKPGGRLMVSDIVLTKPLPEGIRNSIQAYIGCVSGASLKDDYLKGIEDAGFQEITVHGESSFSIGDFANDPAADAIMESLQLTPEKAAELAGTIVSMKVSAQKPK